MKQKNNKVQVKSNLKGVQKPNNNKKQMKKPKPAATLVTAPKNVNKKNKNLKVTPKSKPPKVIEEEEDDSESEEDSGADLEAEETVAGVVDEESDEDSSDEEEKSEEQDADDDDEKQDEENDNAEGSDDEDDSDDNDDEPTEAPIEKNSVPKVGIPKIRTSEISKDYPREKIIVVHNLPKKGEFKQIDLVEIFSKYGTIDTIKPVYQKNSNSSTAFISYTTAEAAAAALAADKMKVKGSTIGVSMKKENNREKIAEAKKKETKKDCVIFVKNMKKDTTEADVRKYFADCGDIEILTVICKKGSAFAFVTFSDPESAQAALKLHHSTLNGKTIGVYMRGDEGHKDPQRTIFLKNLQHVDNFPVETLENIFGKFGEIEDIDIVCMKNILAFITFKNAASAKKALKLSGSTQDDLEIEIGQFEVATKSMNTVFMFNVKPGVEEKDICEFFANTGEIASIFIKTGFAIIKFKDSDGFCKSFLLNESELGGQSVFLEPYSEKKAALTKKHQNSDNRKRPFFNKNQNNKKQRMNDN